MRKLCLMLCCVVQSLVAMAQYNLLPAPRQLTERDGICAYSDDKVRVEMVSEIAGARDYTVDGFGNQAYRLVVTPEDITIQAVDQDGVWNAKATLAQLVANCGGTIPCMEIVDWPSFKVRGWLLDIGRSYFSVEEIKREMDLLSRFKINYFHWHLTENQAWRMEIKAYPQLTAANSMTRDAGRYYTQQECREVVEYAKERGILVVPEIDMPGHSEAFTRAMGFNMASAQGQEALKVILGEVAEVFKESPYIHIGADETSVTAAFVKAMSDRVRELGKKCVTWNPINVAVTPENGIDACQLWSTNGNYARGMVNIDSKYNYVNLHDMFADLVGVFNSNVYKQADGSSDLTGGVACLWTDRRLHSDATASAVSDEKEYIKHNNFYALMLANAERLWVGGRTQYIEQGGTRLANEGVEYDRFVDWENRFLYYKATWLKDEPVPYVRQSNIRWNLTVDGKSQVVTGAGAYLRHAWYPNIPGIVANPQPGMEAVAWTYIYSEKEQDAGAIIEFQTYERSWHDQAPPVGQWDKRGSRIWLNGAEIAAPDWVNAGKSSTFETLMSNENWTMREPVKIHLQQGWNKVLIKMPYASPATSQIRLNRWMWNFVITDTEGRNALDGITFSSDEQPDYVEPEHIEDTAPTFTIRRFGRDNSYMYANGTGISTSSFNEDAKYYWRFIPSGKDDCYYIRNAATGQYIQSPVVIGRDNAITLGGAKVEFYKGHDTTSGASTNNANYWFLASTDNSSFQLSTDGPLGLNWQEANSRVVSYYIKTGRGNSYFEIVQRDMPEPEPDESTDITTQELTSLDQLQNGRLYTIESQRGSLLCDASMLWGSAASNAPDADNAHRRFAIVRSARGNLYIYNYGAKKFLSSSRQLSDTPCKWTFVENVSGVYRWVLSAASKYINMQTASGAAGGVLVDSYSTPDPGNRMKIVAVAEVNVDDVLATIEDYEEEQRRPIAKPWLAQRLGLVRIPCGTRGAWLSRMTVADYTYTASNAPASAYINFAKSEQIQLNGGEDYTLSLTVNGATTDTDVRVFLDWNGDGVYETVLPVTDGTLQLPVPASTSVGGYMRVRITDNGLTEMDSDVEGSVYDFRIKVALPDAIQSTTLKAERNNEACYSLDGRRVNPSKHNGIYIRNGKKFITAPQK